MSNMYDICDIADDERRSPFWTWADKYFAVQLAEKIVCNEESIAGLHACAEKCEAHFACVMRAVCKVKEVHN